jgi:hypothetical protein
MHIVARNTLNPITWYMIAAGLIVNSATASARLTLATIIG